MKYLALIFISTIVFNTNYAQKTRSLSSSTTRIEGNLTVDGRVRTYILHLPSKFKDSTGFSLVIALHGGGGKATQMERDYNLVEKAIESQFVIVFPDGVSKGGGLGLQTWNGGSCCSYAAEKQIDDVKFISLLIDDLIKKYPKINSKKVYATGMSNGAIMSYRLACELSNKIAAIAPVAGTLSVTSTCQPSRPVPILHIHSQLDKKVPYKGGKGIFGIYFNPVDDGIKTWLKNNGCNEASKKVMNYDLYSHTEWTSCNNSPVEIIMTNDGGHSWPGGMHNRKIADKPSKAIVANDVIWAFFQKYQLP